METKECRICHKKLSISEFYPYRNVCKKCYLEQKNNRRNNYIKSGRCYDCGRPINYGRSLYYCSECLESRNKHLREKRKQRKNSGLCIYCGKPIDYTKSTTLCAECYEKYHNQAMRLRLKEEREINEIKKYLEMNHESSKS